MAGAERDGVTAALGQLGPVERRVLELRYGLGDEAPHTPDRDRPCARRQAAPGAPGRGPRAARARRPAGHARPAERRLKRFEPPVG